MSKLTKESAIKIQNDLVAAGIKAYAESPEFYSDAEKAFVTSHRVKASLKDAKTGNGVSRIIDDECNAAAVAKEMKKDLKALAKATRERIATQRFLDRS